MRSMLHATVLLAVAAALGLAATPRNALGDMCQRSCVVGSTLCAREAGLSRRACKAKCASDASDRKSVV